MTEEFEVQGEEPVKELRGESQPEPAADPDGQTPEAPQAKPSSGKVLRGATVAPGLVLGIAHRKDYDLQRAAAERVPLDEVDHELNRLRRALDQSRQQLMDLRARLEGRVQESDARILDTHLAYLKDSVFIADVENLILEEQMRLEAAIAKVVSDFDRIFRLVRDERLRQGAVDLRDVGIRVLRNLEREAAGRAGEMPAGDYILVARELSIVDMFDLSNERVRGIATREGGLTSHAAIFARSMRIPTITGIENLIEEVKEGDFLILDATEGILRVEPDAMVRAQYTESVQEEKNVPKGKEAPEWALRPRRTRDGAELEVLSSCGNLPDVEEGASLGANTVGLYRTELLYLVEDQQPSREALLNHYSAVVSAARGGTVTFRLLNTDASLGLSYLHPEREKNPALGRFGVRALLSNQRVLRRQLQALLMAGHDAQIRLAIPGVIDCGELRRLKEVLFEERLEMRRAGDDFIEVVPVGVVLETPAALLGVRDLALEADFLMLNLDAMQQYLLATDRDRPDAIETFEVLHPVVLRALSKVVSVAEDQGRELSVFGVTSTQPANVPLLVGAGLRRFCVPPAGLRAFLDNVLGVSTKTAARAVRTAQRASSPQEMQTPVGGYRHGYAKD
ncbi:MAG: phosphotransferase system enzyme I (PtsI) [Planctomycetota bacterium]|jgi:phosphotransferase system enzyme I (PtsI)